MIQTFRSSVARLSCQWGLAVGSTGVGRVQKLLQGAVLAAWLGTAVVLAPAVQARQDSATAAQTAVVALAQLPKEAQDTHRLVLSGGPFPFEKDGTAFGNRERLLPQAPKGYYREYTVRTPGARDRGARRLVCGGEPPTRPEVCYFTGDHYASFSRIVP